MILAATADIHLRGKDLAAADAQLAAFVAACHEARVQTWLIAGDLFDAPRIGDPRATTGAIEEVLHRNVLQFLSVDYGQRIVAVVGNHDQAGVTSADALHCLDGYAPRVRVVRDPAVVRCEKVAVAAVPWSWSPNADPEEAIRRVVDEALAMKRRGEVSAIVLLAHLQVGGALMNDRCPCPFDNAQWRVSRAFLDSLPTDVDRLFLGDFHRRQKIVHSRGGYVGAMRQLAHDDTGNPAGFELYDTQTNASRWIELCAAPRYLTLDVPEGADPPDVPNDGNIYRVRFNSRPSAETAKRIEAAGATIKIDMPREERARRADVPLGVVDRPLDLIDLWANTQSPPIEPARVARMKTLFAEALA